MHSCPRYSAGWPTRTCLCAVIFGVFSHIAETAAKIIHPKHVQQLCGDSFGYRAGSWVLLDPLTVLVTIDSSICRHAVSITPIYVASLIVKNSSRSCVSSALISSLSGTAAIVHPHPRFFSIVLHLSPSDEPVNGRLMLQEARACQWQIAWISDRSVLSGLSETAWRDDSNATGNIWTTIRTPVNHGLSNHHLTNAVVRVYPSLYGKGMSSRHWLSSPH